MIKCGNIRLGVKHRLRFVKICISINNGKGIVRSKRGWLTTKEIVAIN